MFELAAIKGLISGIFQKIGLTGIIIIVLLAICTYQQFAIRSKDDKIVTQEVALHETKDQLDAQNKAVVDLGKKRDELQNILDDARTKNKKLATQYAALRIELNNRPPATTCEGAMSEVRNSANDAAKRWNSQ